MMEDFVINPHSVRIKKCCASCKYKVYDKGMKRLCMKGEGHISSQSCCEQWCLDDKLVDAGKSKGRVKSLRYLRFALEQGEAGCSFEQARAKFLEKNESIYLEEE